MDGFMMIAIVSRGDARKVMKTARDNGARGGTILDARGTASSLLLSALGFGDSRKEILLSMLGEDITGNVLGALRDLNFKHKGIVFTLDCRLGRSEEMTKFEMIQVICEDGYADDIMAAARKAGAGGGTIINARGTASPEDASFFGYKLVPEKEMVIIVTPSDNARNIVDAIRTLDCLKQKGKGIVFSLPVSSFETLG